MQTNGPAPLNKPIMILGVIFIFSL